MYCSEKQFIEITKIAGVTPQDLYITLQAVMQLVERRGSRVTSPVLHTLIQEQDAQVAGMIRLLESIDKLDSASLKVLLSEIDIQDTHRFVVRAQKTTDVIHKKLEQQFGQAEIETIPTHTTELQVSGDGRRYKRSLEKDLDKLLK